MRRESTGHVELDDEALKAVANETRLRMVASLGAVVRDGAYGTRSFSELMEDVGLQDSGRTTYHLDRLREQEYVERTDDGYRLTLRGLRIYQFVRSGVLSRSPTVGPFETDLAHDQCGEPLSVYYEEQRVHGVCEACGITIERVPLRPSAFDPTRPESLEAAMRRQMWSENFSLTQGYCLHCGGRVEPSFAYPEGESVVDSDATRGPLVWFSCEICHWFLAAGAEYAGYLHPAVVSFCHERDLDIRAHNPLEVPLDVPEVDARSEDPWRVAVTYAYEGDAITLTFDEDLTVHDVTVEAPGARSADS